MLALEESRFSHQRGIGLIEVMVSILLLATAAMGFALLQNRSAQATYNALQRTYALSILDNLSNQIRVNIMSFGDNSPATSRATDATILTQYQLALTDKSTFPVVYCLPKPDGTGQQPVCNYKGWIMSDYLEAKAKAEDFKIKIGAVFCPSNLSRLCLIAAWNDTNPIMDSSIDSCLTATGDYRSDSDCVMLEVY